MTKEEFYKCWILNYPQTPPISYLFRHNYSHRWFRIHSLPKSKRYADTDEEWKILLTRQNEIITELLGLDTPVLLVIEYEEEIFESYSFTLLDNIDLSKFNSEEYDEINAYKLAFTETIWKPNNHNKLLREIADDRMSAFFVSFEKNIIIAPYDGGVDFILKDILTRDFYKDKYRQYLSAREDGF